MSTHPLHAGFRVPPAAAAVLVAGVLAPAAGAAGPVLQPGDAVTSVDGGSCTLGFVLEGPTETYITTAAHCIDIAKQDRARNAEFGEFGTFVYDNDVPTMDVALVDVDPDVPVDPAVAGHPGTPSGVADPSETAAGDRLRHSGQGLVVARTEPTRQDRPSVLVEHNATAYRSDGLVVDGDSGAPMIHAETGEAVGLVSRYGVFSVPPTTDRGPTLQHVVDVLHGDGYDVHLRTAS